MGLDGMAFDDDEDAFREIRLLWQHHRGYGGKVVLTPERLLQAVLIDGRRSILGEDGGGRLAAGAPADIAVVDLAGMSGDILDGALTPLDLLLTRLTKAQLRELIVAGRTVVADGRCVTVDRVALEGELLDQARAGWRSKPPDLAALGRLQGALRRYYACGCHRHLQPTLAEP
jgi:cytosine/adenosine deaminase-related metal-dependent hydrolase